MDGWVKGFADRKHPIYTFGLGSGCDLNLLESIAHRSNPDDLAGRRAASYNPKDNVKLLEQLQYVEWELREYWKLPLKPIQKKDQKEDQVDLEVFYTPQVQVWHDLGLLMYRQPPGTVRAMAPLVKDVGLPQVAQKLDWLKPMMSRSHWYYALSPLAERPKQAPIDGKLQFTVEHRTPGDKVYQTHCITAVRHAGVSVRVCGPRRQDDLHPPRRHPH